MHVKLALHIQSIFQNDAMPLSALIESTIMKLRSRENRKQKNPTLNLTQP